MTNQSSGQWLSGLSGIVVALLAATAIAFAGSQQGSQVNGFAVFALCGVFAFVVQWLVFLHAFSARTERFFDLTGGITYVSVVWLAVYLSGQWTPRSLLIATLVSVWAVRLSSFLFVRIAAAGEDKRFRSIRQSFPTFWMTWTLQGLWVFLTAAAGLAAITGLNNVDLGLWAILGTLVWGAGFIVEVIADQQKSSFRSDPNNRNRFITHGLWAWSRHPNYFGEILLWVGIALIALPELRGWQYVTLISPVFVYLLLTKISGVRMLEQRAKKQWGRDETYLAYCKRTPVVFPRPPTGHSLG